MPIFTLRSLPFLMIYGLLSMSSMPDRVQAQRTDVNYDEAKVPPYELPELLRTLDGHQVSSAAEWEKLRRPEILKLFAEHVYGTTPEGKTEQVKFEVFESSETAFDGRAVRKQVRVKFGAADGESFDMLMYLPRGKTNVPIFLVLNFEGNHTVHPDPAIKLGGKWIRDANGGSDQYQQAAESTRGSLQRRWPVELMVERGFGIATAHYNEIAPDQVDLAFAHGVPLVFGKTTEKERSSTAWGTIGIWSWGLSRMLDYLEQEPAVDTKRSIVVGHSRLGKTALWAGATDPRFAIVISNNSGCGGAALFRREYGEQVDHMARNFPHWFCRTYANYVNREQEMPVDQHMLIALMAPRPVYVASATEDKWADPYGEYLAARHAEPVYSLFGKEGIPGDSWPAPDQPAHGTIGYHLRTGPHDLLEYDWAQYMDFAQKVSGTVLAD